MNPELTVQEWQYVSFLIANDVANDKAAGLKGVPATKQAIWDKVQPACEWDEEGIHHCVGCGREGYIACPDCSYETIATALGWENPARSGTLPP